MFTEDIEIKPQNVKKILTVEFGQKVINCGIMLMKNSFKLYRFRGNRSVHQLCQEYEYLFIFFTLS